VYCVLNVTIRNLTVMCGAIDLIEHSVGSCGIYLNFLIYSNVWSS